MTTTEPRQSAPATGRLLQLRELQQRRSPRADFAIRRIGRLIVSLLVVVLAAFFLIHFVPGDPVRAALGPTAPAGLVESTRIELGLDKPIPQQLFDYLAGLFQGDLGTSIQTGLVGHRNHRLALSDHVDPGGARVRRRRDRRAADRHGGGAAGTHRSGPHPQ